MESAGLTSPQTSRHSGRDLILLSAGAIAIISSPSKGRQSVQLPSWPRPSVSRRRRIVDVSIALLFVRPSDVTLQPVANPELLQVYLIEWAWTLAEADTLRELLDVRLTSALKEHATAIDTVTKVSNQRALLVFLIARRLGDDFVLKRTGLVSYLYPAYGV